MKSDDSLAIFHSPSPTMKGVSNIGGFRGGGEGAAPRIFKMSLKHYRYFIAACPEK